jgi:hypothetical protein
LYSLWLQEKIGTRLCLIALEMNKMDASKTRLVDLLLLTFSLCC